MRGRSVLSSRLVVPIALVAVSLGACSSDDSAVPADSIASVETVPTAVADSVATDETVSTDVDAAEADDGAPAPTVSSDAEPSSVPGDAPGCAELRVVTENNPLETALSSMLDLAGDPAATDSEITASFQDIADTLASLGPEIRQSYDDAAAAVDDPAVAADIRILSDNTIELIDPLVTSFREATSFDDLDGRLTASLTDPEIAPAVEEAGQAALRLDEFTLGECGFQLSGA